MDHIPQKSPWGSFALVSYVPDPLGSFLDGLRRSLTGEEVPQAHVTILPRRPLALPVDSASDQALKLLAGFRSFAVELSSVRRFRHTNVVYVDITEGNARLHALHDALSLGDLAHNEEFEFRPHLTLACPAHAGDVELVRKAAKTAWHAAPIDKRFLFHEIVCLWLRPDGLQSEWVRLWSHNLTTRHTVHAAAAAFAVTGQTY